MIKQIYVKNILNNALFAAIVSTLLNCASSRMPARNADLSHVSVSILAGSAAGGLVDNRKLLGETAAADLDAITGATKSTLGVGVHTEIPVGKIYIESGIDYLGFNQSFSFDHTREDVFASKSLTFHQLRAPLTINFHLLPRRENRPRLILRAGVSAGYTFHKSIIETGVQPDYEFYNWDIGPTLGATYFPVILKNGQPLGFFLDVYRGSRIFDDIYHQEKGVGAQSYFKLGLVYQPLTIR